MEIEKQSEILKGSTEENELRSQAPDPQEATKQLAEESSPVYQKLLAEKQDLYERLLRKQAELENFRKRMQKEKEEFQQQANADLVRSLLPALDAFERALKHRDSSVAGQFYEGVELIYRQLLDALGRAGVKPVDAQGKAFDPELHEAVGTVEAEEHHGDQEVVEEVQRGYKLRQRLLRPAVVKVAVHSRNKKEEPSPNHSAKSN